MNNQKHEDLSACAHLHVERFQIEKDGRVFEEQWRCKECGEKFYCLKFNDYMPQIQIMEPVKTLRDEFAMAALSGDWASQGADTGEITNSMAEENPGWFAERAKVYYVMADAMLKVRK